MNKLTMEEAERMNLQELKQLELSVWEYDKMLDKVIKYRELKSKLREEVKDSHPVTANTTPEEAKDLLFKATTK